MIKPNFILVYTLFFFLSQNFYGQEKNNQIGLNADDVIPALFSSDSRTFNLLYRNKLDNNKHLRIGIKYSFEEDDEFSFGIKPGIDFLFKKSDKWHFNYGIDAIFIHNNSYVSERKYYEYAILPFFRAEFIFSENFSISTEPGIFFRIVDVNDIDNSPIDNSHSTFSSGLTGLGFIKFNFSF